MRRLGDAWDGALECDVGMTNYDHSIDGRFEQALRAGRWGRHAAWNFNGRVWFEEGRFHEEVWIYGDPIAVLSAATLKELMAVVNERYGAE